MPDPILDYVYWACVNGGTIHESRYAEQFSACITGFVATSFAASHGSRPSELFQRLVDAVNARISPSSAYTHWGSTCRGRGISESVYS